VCRRPGRDQKWEYNEAVHQLFIDFKKACDSVIREVLDITPQETGNANTRVSE
jgi:hypothetical protein